jgi:hypothetical protein
VILPTGTKYVSSVRFGSVSQIRPGQPAKVIAAGIPSAASTGYDSKQNQLIIPMNNNNAVAFHQAHGLNATTFVAPARYLFIKLAVA